MTIEEARKILDDERFAITSEYTGGIVMRCDKRNCLANLDGECCAEECKGELLKFVHFPKGEILREDEAAARGAFYKMMAKCFEEDFKERKQ